MTDQELKDLVASLAIESKKTEELIRESSKIFDEKLQKELEIYNDKLQKENEAFDRRMQKLENKLDKIGAIVGSIGHNQGDVAEEYFVNSLSETLQVAGMSFDTLLENVGMKQKGIRDEFDILLVNGESVAIIEVKYKVHPNILESLPNKIAHLKAMPQYKNYKVYAGIAGFYIPKEVIEEATKRGYFVLQRKGDVIQTYANNLKVA